MDKPTFADLEYQGKKCKTRRQLFLERMDGLIPWESLERRGLAFFIVAPTGSGAVGPRPAGVVATGADQGEGR